MSNDDEYRRQATFAEQQAKLAKNDLERESWLRIVQGYLGLLRKRPQSEDDSNSSK